MEQGDERMTNARQGPVLQLRSMPQPITNQPDVQPTPATARPEANLPPTGRKRRKPNAKGNRKRSEVWDHFNIIPNSDPETAACKHCHQRYGCSSKNGTSNMKNHLMNTCPIYPFSLKNDRTQTILKFPSTEGADLVAVTARFDQLDCRNALAVYIILDEKPFRTVEGEGFKYFCSRMQPQFSIPSRRTIARDCFKLYLEEKIKLKALFKSDCSRVAITTDCWTSVQNLNYLTVTAHFIDREWKYQKRIVSFTTVPNHKGETVGKKLEEVLKEWGLRNVSTVTVDNASSNDVAVAYLKKRIKNMNGLLFDGFGFHMRCCAHVLNLVVGDGLKDLHPSVSSVRNAVRFVRSSPHRAAKFKECIEFAGIECKKLVCLDVSTRWNSTYLMLAAAEKYQAAFDKLEDADASYRDYFDDDESPPSNFDWENVRAFVKFLKYFYEATIVFSVSTEASLHTAFPHLATIFIELKKSAMNLNGCFATVAKDMLQKYNRYWGNIGNMNQLIYFGVILDPRFKLRYVEWCFEDMYENESAVKEKLLETINNNLSKMYDCYKQANDNRNTSRDSASSVVEAASHVQTAVETTTQLARENAFQNHLKVIDSVTVETELQGYLKAKNIEFVEKFDILSWWKNKAVEYPILSQLVRDIMPTPVSTVASESAFSTGGRVLEVYRSSLKPDMAEALICTQNWLRPSFYQFKAMEFDEEYEICEDALNGLVGSSAASGQPSQSQPSGCV
ncbi:unnamed protein product [Trifolium pratense]|uniref:Uncharacterized protein n=1 Tax=Trifolium pratense TaxID=57577 RepID=A0ACB0JKU4_TRIPR|nr:unnamed protein product [Trifolium pratense]